MFWPRVCSCTVHLAFLARFRSVKGIVMFAADLTENMVTLNIFRIDFRIDNLYSTHSQPVLIRGLCAEFNS